MSATWTTNTISKCAPTSCSEIKKSDLKLQSGVQNIWTAQLPGLPSSSLLRCSPAFKAPPVPTEEAAMHEQACNHVTEDAR